MRPWFVMKRVSSPLVFLLTKLNLVADKRFVERFGEKPARIIL